jgi:hypothetical protein
VRPEGCEVGAATAGSLFSAVLWTQRRTARVANSSFPFGNFLEFNFFPTRFEQWAAELVPRCALPSHVGRDRRTEERQSNVTQNQAQVGVSPSWPSIHPDEVLSPSLLTHSLKSAQPKVD